MDEFFNIKESDYNTKKAQELYGKKTLEELKKEIEDFEKKFKEQHKD